MEIEPIQFITGSLRICDVFVDNKCRTLGVGRDTLTDLSRFKLARLDSPDPSQYRCMTQVSPEVAPPL